MKYISTAITTFLFALTSISGYGQPAWIEGQLTGFNDSNGSQWVYLLRTGMLRTTELVDSVSVNEDGTFLFANEPSGLPGLFYLRFNNGTPKAIFSADKDRIRINSTASDLFYGKALIEGSDENSVFEKLEEIRERNETAQRISGTAYDTIDFFNPKYNTLTDKVRDNYEVVLKSSNEEIMKLREQNAGTFVTGKLASLYYEPLKSETIDSDTLYDNNLAFQHDHFLDSFDLNDVRLAYYDIFYDRLDEYMGNYIDGSSLDGLMKGVYNIMRRVNNAETRSAIALYLGRSAKKVKQHDLADHILDTYYNSGCDIAVDNNWNEIVSTLRAASVGSMAPDPRLPDSNGRDISLSSIADKKAIIVYFWSSHCQYCLDALPEFLRFYEMSKEKGLEVYAVSLDEDVKAWKQFIGASEFPWINVCDGSGAEGEHTMVYGLRGTPTYFLLDGNKQIRFRTHDLHELMAKVRDML